jgi:hypothetical protein
MPSNQELAKKIEELEAKIDELTNGSSESLEKDVWKCVFTGYISGIASSPSYNLANEDTVKREIPKACLMADRSSEQARNYYKNLQNKQEERKKAHDANPLNELQKEQEQEEEQEQDDPLSQLQEDKQ